MTDANIKQLIERLRQRSNSRHMLLTDPPKPAPDADCHAAADMLEQYLATKQELSAFRQEVSDAVINSGTWNVGKLKRFIIPAPEPDPLVEVITECDDGTWETKEEYADKFRAALEASGWEIREKGQ